MNDLPEITIPRPHGLRGYYIEHVIGRGHIPGVLSGAELKGKAKRYGGGYARRRGKAAAIVAAHGIEHGYALVNSRWARVWIKGNQRVRVTLA